MKTSRKNNEKNSSALPREKKCLPYAHIKFTKTLKLARSTPTKLFVRDETTIESSLKTFAAEKNRSVVHG